MSFFTDFRDSVEDSIGVGPDSTGADLAAAAGQAVRAAGPLITSSSGSSAKPPAKKPPLPTVQKVSQFVNGNQKTLLMIAGALGLFLILKRVR